jgi:hypothetical protein
MQSLVFIKTSTTADAKFSRFAAKTFLSASAVVAYRELTLRYFPVGLSEGIQGDFFVCPKNYIIFRFQ